MTPAQITALRAACFNDPTAAALISSGDANGLYAWLNAVHPTYTVWRSLVGLQEVGRAINAGELAGITAIKTDRLNTFANYIPEGVEPFRADHRAFFDEVFSGAGGQITRGNLLTLWKRKATNAERLLATGTGTESVPATLSFEGEVTQTEAVGIVYRDNGTIWTP